MSLLKSKVVVVTGASSGFGEAAAHLLAQQGAALVICGRRAERLEALAAQLAPAPVHVLALDVRDRKAVFSAFESLPTAFKNVYGLVNNAGLALGLEPAHETNLDHWEQMVDTNVKGLMYCTRALLPGMAARNAGHIVNISSTAAIYAYPGGNAYGGSKAFVSQFSMGLRADLLGKQVRVTCLEPGMAETEFSLVRFEGNAPKANTVYDGITPMSANDVAEAVVWCMTRPAHVNINRMELMPTMQAPAGLAVHRAKAQP